jgi:lipoteichoic acid synthase
MRMLAEKAGFATRRFIISMIFLHAVSFLFHLAEVIVSAYGNQVSFDILSVFYAFISDSVLIAHIGLVLFPVYVVLYFGSDFTARMLMSLLLIILICTEFALMQYYLTAHVPLGSDFWSYSWKDIQLTVKASADISWWQIMLFPILLGFALRGHYSMQQYTFSLPASAGTAGAYAAVAISASIIGYNEPENINQKNLALNKADYFLLKSREYFAQKNTSGYDVPPQLLTNNKEFPFQVKQSTTDALGPLLEKDSVPPNIVLVLVEGLGKTFVGPGADYAGCMPFLDSLSTKSLFWTNFLSTTGRTFGVLPSALGSLPYGPEGFMELGNNAPDHLSLVSLLKQNGYQTGFYYGGDASFDKQDIFLEREGIDYILDAGKFTSNYTKIPVNEGGFSWGYPDRELYRRSFDVLKDKAPYFSIYLTVTTHEPFKFPGSEAYDQKMNAFISRSNNEQVIANKDAFRTLMYADDALRYFIEAYQQRPDYQNTIFIITGDHRMIPVQHKNAIDRYNVPLIIFSPLLKTGKVFRSVCAHNDLPSTLIAYLYKQYNLSFPDSVHWLGEGLTFNTGFSSNKELAIMRNKGDISEYVNGTNFLTDGELYEIGDGMVLTGKHNDEIKDAVNARLQQFKQLNLYTCSKNKIYSMKNASVATKPVNTISAEQEKQLEEHGLPADRIDDIFEKARQLAYNKKYDEAVQLCNTILVQKPNYIDTYLLKARTYAWKDDYASAKQTLNEAVKRNEGYKETYETAIDIELMFGHNEDARAWYYKAIEQFGMDEFKEQLKRIKAARN